MSRIVCLGHDQRSGEFWVHRLTGVMTVFHNVPNHVALAVQASDNPEGAIETMLKSKYKSENKPMREVPGGC